MKVRYSLKVEYDFIPQKVYVGRFMHASAGIDCGFVTCKHKESKWLWESVFSRLTGGFKPHVQRDAEVELTKTIHAAVGELDNAPEAGFKLVLDARHELHNIYSIAEFKDASNWLVEDPRGFVVAVSRKEVMNILACNGGNIKDGVFAGKCCYAFSTSAGRACLIPANDQAYEDVKAASDVTIKMHHDRAHLT